MVLQMLAHLIQSKHVKMVSRTLAYLNQSNKVCKNDFTDVLRAFNSIGQFT